MPMLIRFALALVLSFIFIESPIVNSRVYAGMITTHDTVASLTFKRDKIKNFVTRGEVKVQLTKLGVSEQEAVNRIATLSDSEVKKIASEIDQATAGGDIIIGLGALLLIILIVWLIVDND